MERWERVCEEVCDEVRVCVRVFECDGVKDVRVCEMVLEGVIWSVSEDVYDGEKMFVKV